jgi:hypothetical protein
MALPKMYYTDLFDWHIVVSTDKVPANAGGQRGWRRSWAKKTEAYHPDGGSKGILKNRSGLSLSTALREPFITGILRMRRKGRSKIGAERGKCCKAAMVLERLSRSKENKKWRMVKREESQRRPSFTSATLGIVAAQLTTTDPICKPAQKIGQNRRCP